MTTLGRLTPPNPPTEAMVNYVRVLQKKHHLPNDLLDNHCIERFGLAFSKLAFRQVSELIDEMIEWGSLPADLMRAKGQLDLFGEMA